MAATDVNGSDPNRADPAGGRALARIGKPHGLRGEVTVQLHTDEPERRFAPGAVLGTRAAVGSGVPQRLTVRGTRIHQGIWLLAFEEIPDRTGAESLRGTRLVLLGDDAAAPGTEDADEDGWYEDELVGLTVTDTTGAPVGTVTGLELGAAQDRLVIALVDGNPAYVPLVEALVPEIDPDAGRVVIDPPPGLLELYRES